LLIDGLIFLPAKTLNITVHAGQAVLYYLFIYNFFNELSLLFAQLFERNGCKDNAFYF